MPCRDDRDYDYTASQTELAAANAAADKSAHLLCEACSLLEEVGLLHRVSDELHAWYQLHEQLEADRVRLEAAQKLTERERRLLGLNLTELKRKAELERKNK